MSSKMRYLVIVITHNDIQVIKPFNTLTQAQTVAIETANEFYSQDAIHKFFDGSTIETITQLDQYYASETYYDFEDSAHVIIEEVEL